MRNKRIFLITAFATILAGCGGSSDGSAPQIGDVACSNDGQKQFVLDAMRDVYFWQSLLPANVSLDNYSGPDDLLEYLVSFQPLDTFSFINSAEADTQFFGAGQYFGFGFSYRFETADELRFTQVFSDSPAAQAGFARGQQIISIDGRTVSEIEMAEGVDALFDQATIEFTIRELDDGEFTVSVSKDVVTINPLPQWRVIDTPGGSVGYVEFATFVSTADPVFDLIFEGFRQTGVTDVILDMRYNGGGLVSTAELLGDFLGGDVANGLVFSRTLFNSNNAGFNRSKFFQQLGNSMNLSRLVIVATNSTASASELVTNSMEPHVEVSIVGDTTFGKPVGQVGIEFCSKILRATAFETVNSLDQGGYFNGLQADCAAPDDLDVPVGDDADPNLMTALSYLANGACPAVADFVSAKPGRGVETGRRIRHAPPWLEFAGAN